MYMKIIIEQPFEKIGRRNVDGIHFLLTYRCTLECDHCFVFGGPHAPEAGTFTLEQVRRALEEAARIGTVEWVYFEGGEPFLFYPLMLEGISLAEGMGFKVGVVTNSYYATSDEDAELWLRPLVGRVMDLSISDDALHHGDADETPPKRVLRAAERLGIPASSICISVPDDVMFKGRAAEKLAGDFPKKRPGEFTECPHEELEEPGRVHVDAYGNVHVCQGISMGNMWETPLLEIARGYDAASHPICGPLVRGGPLLLAEKYGVALDGEGYVDACHMCYIVRRALVDRFPQFLAPRQVYGLT